MDESPEVLTRLTSRLTQLEQRVFFLEHPSDVGMAVPAQFETAAPELTQASALSQSGSMFPVLGRAMLGMAGAYVLRAVAESGSVPKLAVVVLAIAYAAMWLVWAVRVSAQEWFASAIYAGTSALILAPMLWELTLRFNVLSPSTAAFILAAFAFASYALAWKRCLTSVVWVANLTIAFAALSLLVATHDMVPFIAVLLLMAALSEFAVVRNRWLGVRAIAAVAADLAIWSLVFIYSVSETSRADYTSLTTIALIAPAAILLCIYAANVVLRTCLRRQTITVFEACQSALAFLLFADAVLHFASPAGVNAFAALCLALSVAGYTALFVRFGAIAQQRNYQVYGAWSMALLLMGAFQFLGPMWLPAMLGAAAIATTSLALRESRLTLAFHGIVYLNAAAFACGCLQYAVHVLAGAFPEPPAAMAWIISGSTVLCYAVAAQLQGGHWKLRLFHVLSATLAVGAMASILVSSMVWITATVITPGASHVAVIRTLGACSLALALAFIGSRWNHIELVWVAYGTLALVTAKLLFEDLRQGRPEFIAASIFLYAITLIMVPRVARRSSKKQPKVSPEGHISTAPIEH